MATIATPEPGTSTGAAHSPLPMAPTLLTLTVPPLFGISFAVKPLGTLLPNSLNLRISPEISYADLKSTAVIVGVYNPVGVLNAREMSACGRRVRVGFSGELVEVEDVGVVAVLGGLKDVLKSGHSIIARESALMSRGRMVKRLYCRDVSTDTSSADTEDEAEKMECGETAVD